MRKKQLLQQNISLFEQLQKSNLSVTALKRELSSKEAEIKNLKSQLNDAEKVVPTTPLQNLEQKVSVNPSVSDDVEYGAQVIGKIVVEAACYSNKLTGKDAPENAKELVNLILGRTEVAKAEILGIVSSQADNDVKHSCIDEQYQKACEYFSNVMAQ